MTKYNLLFDYNKENKIFSRRKYGKSKRNFKERKIKRGGVKWHREKIIEMAEKIENERFLKAIYISMSEYLKEKEPD